MALEALSLESQLSREIAASPIIRERARRSDLSYDQLADYGFMIAGVLVRTVSEFELVMDNLTDGTQSDSNPRTAEMLLALAHYLGETTDLISNTRLSEIFGNKFTDSVNLGKDAIRKARNPYMTVRPRAVTPEDEEVALALDREIIQNGVRFLMTDEAKRRIWEGSNRILDGSEGCPLLFTAGDGISSFDKVLAQLLAQYAASDPRFFTRTFHGPADLSLKYLGKISEAFKDQDYSSYEWNLPAAEPSRF